MAGSIAGAVGVPGFAIHRVVVLAENQTRLCIHAHVPHVSRVGLFYDHRPCQAHRAVLLEFEAGGNGNGTFGNGAAFEHEILFVDLLAQGRRREAGESEVGKCHFDCFRCTERRDRCVRFGLQFWHKAVAERKHVAVGLHVQTKQTVEQGNALVLLLHPYVGDTVVFGQILVSDTDIGYIGLGKTKFCGIFLQETEGGLAGIGGCLSLCGHGGKQKQARR